MRDESGVDTTEFESNEDMEAFIEVSDRSVLL